MNPRFLLNSGYVVRSMEFVLSRSGRGWQFFGRDKDGYSVIARNTFLEPMCSGMIFATQGEAVTMAKMLNLPAYAVWNGRKRKYEGRGVWINAYPRDYPTNAPRDENPQENPPMGIRVERELRY